MTAYDSCVCFPRNLFVSGLRVWLLTCQDLSKEKEIEKFQYSVYKLSLFHSGFITPTFTVHNAPQNTYGFIFSRENKDLGPRNSASTAFTSKTASTTNS